MDRTAILKGRLESYSRRLLDANSTAPIEGVIRMTRVTLDELKGLVKNPKVAARLEADFKSVLRRRNAFLLEARNHLQGR